VAKEKEYKVIIEKILKEEEVNRIVRAIAFKYDGLYAYEGIVMGVNVEDLFNYTYTIKEEYLVVALVKQYPEVIKRKLRDEITRRREKSVDKNTRDIKVEADEILKKWGWHTFGIKENEGCIEDR